jgi:acyl-CoA thioesterase I
MRASDIDSFSAARRAFGLHCSALALGGLVAASAPANAQGASRTLLIVGDSLSAEYGLARGSGWVALLEARLAQEGPAVNVVNASISGDTTSGGRSRLPALLARHKPKVVVLELGGNDALRGLPLAATQANKYSDEFQALFGKVAKAEGAALVPFLLAGVADIPNADEMFQPDRIHPKAEAHPRMLANVWPVLKPLLR